MNIPVRIGWFVLSLLSFTLLSYGLVRSQFIPLVILYGLLFFGYIWITKSLWPTPHLPEHTSDSVLNPDRFLFIAAILFRVSLLAVVPNLSDDYVRFVWDGHLVANGYNPYLYLPSQIVHTPIAVVANLTEQLYKGLNSPQYYSVYPPVNQAIFGLAARLFPDNLLGNLICLRIPILVAETGSLWLLTMLLKRTGLNPNLALLYGLNPLVILELTGNIHFEAIMIFFALLSAWLFTQKRQAESSVALALSIGSKLLPVLFFPLLLRYLGWKRGVVYGTVSLGLAGLLFLPFIDRDLLHHLNSSLSLYFQKFEFNASLYYLIRGISYLFIGHDTIVETGQLLPTFIIISTIVVVFWGSIHPANDKLPTKLVFTLTLYWLLSTTVHPWYITTLLVITPFTRFRYPIVWSGLIILSYGAYRTNPFTMNSSFVVLEYCLLLTYAAYERYITSIKGVIH